MMTKHITTVTGSHLILYQIGEAYLVMPGGIYIRISRVVYLPTSTKNLLSFQDIRRNGFHLRTAVEDNQKLLHILDRKGCPIENILAYFSSMYIVLIICLSKGEDAAFCVNTWHERMDHPGVSMMRRIIPSTKGHKLQVSNLLKEELNTTITLTQEEIPSTRGTNLPNSKGTCPLSRKKKQKRELVINAAERVTMLKNVVLLVMLLQCSRSCSH